MYQITKDVDPKTVQEHLSKDISFTYCPCTTEEDIIKNCQEAEGIISIYEPMTEKVMKSLPHLKYICLGSIGYNAVDVKSAEKLGIEVSTNPTYCIHEVADHTLALILGLIRNIEGFQESVKREKQWDYTAFGNSFRRVSALTFGIIGFGNIAREVAKRLQGFGPTILAYDPYVKEEVFQQAGVEQATLEEIQNRGDVITVHLPLTPETKGIIGEEFLKGCKKSPYLVNVSRGELVDEKVIQKGLDEGWIKGAALDVLSEEDPDLDQVAFLEDHRVLLTPHVAFYSQESILEADSNCGKYISQYAENKRDNIPFITGRSS